MGLFSSLLGNGLKVVFSNYRGIIVAAVLGFALHSIWSIGQRLDVLGERTESAIQEIKSMRGDVNKLRELSDELLSLQQQQIANTQLIGQHYNDKRSATQRVTDGYIDSVTNGTLRLSIKRTRPTAPTVLGPAHQPSAGTPSAGISPAASGTDGETQR